MRKSEEEQKRRGYFIVKNLRRRPLCHCGQHVPQGHHGPSNGRPFSGCPTNGMHWGAGGVRIGNSVLLRCMNLFSSQFNSLQEGGGRRKGGGR